MRIGYDLRRIGNPGIGRYMQRIVDGVLDSAPQHEYVLIMAPGTESMIKGRDKSNVTIVVTDLPYYSVREQFELRRIARRHRFDLFHSPHFLMPLLPNCPTVITIHDVIYIACPDDLESRIGRIYYKLMMKAAARKAERIITDSEFSKQDIIRLLSGNSKKIDVVLLGVDCSFSRVEDEQALRRVRSKYGATSEFILYTGIYKLRKNHEGLLRAFANARTAGLDTQLLIAGPIKEGKAVLQRLASNLGIAADVVFCGFVEESDLPALYSAARAYACPSNYEGFGFTILEAMACGTPVVCNPVTSLPEVGRDAVLWADAQSAREFGSALLRVCTDETLRAELVRKGYENADAFRWEECVAGTLAVYDRVSRPHISVERPSALAARRSGQ